MFGWIISRFHAGAFPSALADVRLRTTKICLLPESFAQMDRYKGQEGPGR